MSRAPENAIPVTVIGGYLGAGKTTVLNALLSVVDGPRLGVVVNDFGEVGIDAALVADAAGDAPVVNLANGCVCCTLGGDLGSALELLASQSPRLDHIVVEASGVADPAGVAAWGSVPPFAQGGVVVVAAADTVRTQADNRYVGNEVRRQLAAADLVLLTKLDRCSAGTSAEIRRWLDEIAAAPVLDVERGNVSPDMVLGPSLGRDGNRLVVDAPAEGHQSFVRWSLTTEAPVARDALDAFLASLPPGVLRLKGIVALDDGGHVVVQVVGRTIEVSARAGPSVPSQLIAIGVDGVFEASALDALAARHLKP